MDDIVVRQLTRQLKILNFWITLFGSALLICMIVIGILIFKLVTFTHRTEQTVSNLQQKTEQSLNLQQKLCDSKVGSSLFSSETSVCK